MAVSLFLVFVSAALLLVPQGASAILAWIATPAASTQAAAVDSGALPPLPRLAGDGGAPSTPTAALPRLAAVAAEPAAPAAAPVGAGAEPPMTGDAASWADATVSLSFMDGLAPLAATAPPPEPGRQTTSVRPPPPLVVQVGSFRTDAEAREGWRRLRRSHPDLFADRSGRVERADLGSRGAFFRLLAATHGAGEAFQLCQRIKDRGLDCLVMRSPPAP